MIDSAEDIGGRVVQELKEELEDPICHVPCFLKFS